MRIGYGKLGRVVELDPAKWGTLGGDNEAPSLLLRLAAARPHDTFVMLSNNGGWEPPLPNIENPWTERSAFRPPSGADTTELFFFFEQATSGLYDNLDEIVMWLGQHSGHNSPLPKITNRELCCTPLTFPARYAGHICSGINRWREEDPVNREPVYLNSDIRNYLRARDLKWPHLHPVLSQYNYSRKMRHERWGHAGGYEPFADVITDRGDGNVWTSVVSNVYAGLELAAELPAVEWQPWSERSRFGFLGNYQADIPERNALLDGWVRPAGASWIHGKWPAEYGDDITPLPYTQVAGKLAATRSIFTGGAAWPTLKFWEAVNAGCVCFMAPGYDDQGHLLDVEDDEERELSLWLRPPTPEALRKAVDAVSADEDTYLWLAGAQKRALDRRLANPRIFNMINERLDGQ